MTTSPDLRLADITDRMKDIKTGHSVRLSGFYRITEHHAPSFLGGGLIRSLIRCLPDDPRMAVISSTAACGLFHRPWELEWISPISWDAKTISRYRDDWRMDVERGEDTHTLRSSGYPELFARFPALTNHEHLLIAGWQRDCDTRIRTYEARLREEMSA